VPNDGRQRLTPAVLDTSGDRSRLEAAPSYTISDLPNWSDQSYRRRIDEYYGVPPYGGV
jgi:hypothetical protein